MKTVYPSEILDGKEKERAKENLALVDPQARLIARFFDYAVWIGALYLLHRIFGGQAPFAQYERMIPYEFVTWIPIESVLLYAWGKTPGKFFLKIHLTQGRRERLDIGSAFRRSFFVWFRGLGMMIPVINFLCLLVAYQRLKMFHLTSWDRDEHTRVTQDRIGTWRKPVAIFFIALIALFIYFPSKIGLR